jgi:hypothetical protein
MAAIATVMSSAPASTIDADLPPDVIAKHGYREGKPAALGAVDQTLGDEPTDRALCEIVTYAKALDNGAMVGGFTVSCDRCEKPPFEPGAPSEARIEEGVVERLKQRWTQPAEVLDGDGVWPWHRLPEERSIELNVEWVPSGIR